MNATELFNLAPYGAFVEYSDGTPKPPARHKHKLRYWQSRNNAGYFTGKHLGEAERKYDPDTVKLTRFGDVITYSEVFPLNDNRDFRVVPPKPGTIIGYHVYPGHSEIEVSNVWPNIDAALAWARQKGYKLATCGMKYYEVAHNGALVEHLPKDG